MAAPMLLRCSRGFISKLSTGPCYSSSSADPAANPLKGVVQYLCNRFYDIEAFVEFGSNLKKWNQLRKNKYYAEMRERYGDDLSAAIFVLSLKGGIRFQGQEEWYRETKRWKQIHNLLQCQELPVEAIDVSGLVISYEGLDNLVNLKALKYLDLSRCASIDDWSLSRLYAFGDTLQELSLAGCPQVTERGLATLHHLVNLQRLDVSNLPSVSYKGLVRILLEEMLPQCDIVGMDYEEGLLPCPELDALQGETEELQNPACKQKSSEIPA
ncbi:distal membrane-arm assembly complex protein 2 [Tiliqua scincoides]|uniref:distal membrane-arm assembly complex protein 2 n=1 Tax=Tiliqua scincoides TaxID=71010 RepID=UPI003461C102